MTEMPTYSDAAARAEQQVPFSNGTEGDAWMADWCERPAAPCSHDNLQTGGELSCPLLEVALLGATPAEWGERTDALGHGMYECSLYEPEPATRPYALESDR